jgi:hypothetical protein
MVGALSGWITTSLLSDNWTWWLLPVLLLVYGLLTINGDNIIESSVVLVIFGMMLLLLARKLHSIESPFFGFTVGGLVGLVVSKLGFALAKEGAFRNRPFS